MNINFFNDLFFEGVVESVDDPKKQGRLQVRVYGVHPPLREKTSTTGVPTENLPWMIVIQDIGSASMTGVGMSPVGIVCGTAVFGVWRDQYKQDGRILGTIAGTYKDRPNSNIGFSDPSGQYPTRTGSDINVLSDGGEAGKKSPVVVIRDENATIAVNPDITSLSDVPEDDDPNFTIEDMLKGDEGVRNKWYYDQNKYPHIGIGHLLIKKVTSDTVAINKAISDAVGRTVTNGTITGEEVSALLKKDLNIIYKGIEKSKRLSVIYPKLNTSRKMAIINMCYQMGVGGVEKFTNTLNFIENEEWEKAYYNMKKSRWAEQTKGRANRVSRIILTGNLESYGILVDAKKTKLMSMSRASDPIDDPEAPFTPTDSRIMFTEPKSSYDASYPYNKVFTSRSGHVEEFDDTPSQERYNRVHPTGTYEETRPDGTRVVKIFGDDYEIILQDKNLNVKGNLNIVIEGDAKIYNMGNVSQTIDGNVNQFIRGNVNETIEGEINIVGNKNSSIQIDKDSTVDIGENCFINVKDNAKIKVDNDATINVGNNAVIDVENSFDITADDITMTGRNTVKIDSGSLTEVTGGNVRVG